MPMAKEFNEKVAMGLKQWNGLWISDIIYMWSRYTVSVFISRKRPSDVIDSLMTNWLGVFGIMGLNWQPTEENSIWKKSEKLLLF